MSASQALSLSISKNACASPQIPSPSQSQIGSSPSTESHTQRRTGGSGSFGAGSNARSTSSTGRNNQYLKKQHRSQRRPRLADEDATVESVSGASLQDYSLGYPGDSMAHPYFTGGHAVNKQSKGSYLHNPSHEFHTSSSSTQSSAASFWPQRSTKPYLGIRLRLSCY